MMLIITFAAILGIFVAELNPGLDLDVRAEPAIAVRSVDNVSIQSSEPASVTERRHDTSTVTVTTDNGVVVLIKEPHFAALFIGGSVLFVALFSSWLRRMWITGPMTCLVVGILLGPLGLREFLPIHWPNHAQALELIARATLAVSLMAAALHLPRDWLHRCWRSTTGFLLLTMGLMWAASTLLIGLILNVGWMTALLLGAIITPTDPVLATAIVTGPLAERAIPSRLRNLLHAESAANDGLALVFVMVPVLLIMYSTETALNQLAVHVILWQILGASALGALAGWLIGLLQRVSTQRSLAQFSSLLSVALALAVMVAGGVRAADGDGVLAVFAAGIAFRLTIPEDAIFQGESQVQEAVQRLFQLPIFVLIGMMLPWSEWLDLGWRAPALVLGVLVLRRIPALLLIKPIVKPIRRWREALFCGWFGPIGISAVFYAALTQRLVDVEAVWPVTSLLVVTSTVMHGLTATPFAHWLARRKSGPQQ